MRSVFLLRLGLILTMVACHKRSAPRIKKEVSSPLAFVRLTPTQIVQAGIESMALTPASFTPRLAVYATISADPKHLAKVGPRMAGRISRVNVTLGQRVKKGQVLLEMDTVEFHETSQKYLTALARYQEASRAFDRAKRTLSEGVGTQSEYDRAEANMGASQAALRESEEHLHALGLAESDIEALRNNTSHGSDHSHVLAPIEGTVSSLDVSVGKVVSGTEELITIAETSVLWASLRIYERDMAAVVKGARTEVRVTAYPERTFAGEIAFVSDVVDPISRTLEARVPLDNPNGELRPGMTGRGWVTVKQGAAMLTLPVEAVQHLEGKTCVFLEVPGQRYEVREVQVESDQGDTLSIVSGLRAGDRVVTSGALILKGEWDRQARSAVQE